jgi:iron(III) transport system permease protein
MDSQLEESAEIAGITRWQILRRITFPLMAPAFLSALVLTFGKALGSFGGPALLGGPIRYYVLPTALFAQLGFGETAGAYILAIVLIAIGSVTVFINARVLKNKGRYQTVGGKGVKSTPVRLKVWRTPITLIIGSFIAVWVVVPLALLLLSSTQRDGGVFNPENLGLDFWIGESDPNRAYGEPGVFQNPVVLTAVWNSLSLAAMAAAIGAVVGLLISYVVVRRKSPRLAAFIDHLAFIPLLIPSIAFGAMYLSLFAVPRGPMPALYGTVALLVLIAVVKELPFTTRTSAAALVQVGGELDDAAQVQGVRWGRRFLRIVVPLARSGIAAGAMISFISIMRELSLFILLITPGTTLLIYLSYSYTKDMVQLANAVMLLIIVITMIFQVAIWKLGQGPMAKAQQNGHKA